MRNIHSKNRGQHLIEFAFVVPILMIVVFIIVEIGMALNARMTVSEAVKAALVEVNNINSLGGTGAGGNMNSKIIRIENYIGSQVSAYLMQHNIPNSGSVTVNINVKNDYAIVNVNYEYNPVFTLPGMGKVIPQTYKFSSSQTLNPHIFQSNVFPGTRTTSDLSLYHQSSFDNYNESGELINNVARIYTAFLIHMYELYPNFEDYFHARLVSWEGYDLLPPNLRINLKTGTLEVRSPYYVTNIADPWIDTRIPYVWVVSTLGINHLIYVKYNSDRIQIEDTAGLYYKLRFDFADSFYNLGLPFCQDAAACSGNLIGTNTVNERAIRFNPRIGNATPWNDTHIIGTAEPVRISDVNSPLRVINSPYFSYTTDYDSWSSVNWQNRYLLTIAAPYLRGFNLGMPDMIYDIAISQPVMNSLFTPYQYRLMLCEANPEGGGCTHMGVGVAPGVYMGAAPSDGSQDGNIDANRVGGGAGWDMVETVNDNYYVADIWDVIIDSDGDGIPDAWDRDPSYFDVNVNGTLDGNEIDSTLFNTNNRCNDSTGNPYDYTADPAALCTDFPDTITVGGVVNTHTVAYPTDFTFLNAKFGVASPFYSATPYLIDGSFNTTAAFADFDFISIINIPAVNMMDMWIYEPTTGPAVGESALYFDTTGANNTFTRRYPTWHSQVFLGCVNPNSDFSGCAGIRRAQKVITGYMNTSPSGNAFILNASNEFGYLYGGRFAPASKVGQTPPNDW